MIFTNVFVCAYAKADTEYKSAKGISLPEVIHDRQIEKTGECGEGLSYTLEDDGTLTITGNGKIDAGAFSDVPAIRNVIINEGVSDIGDSAFSDTWNIVSISLPKSIKRIESSAFGVCRSLESVNIPEGVVYIGKDAFACCFAMRELYIPDSLTDIGDSAFFGCVNLEKISVSGGNTAYDSRKECNALIDSQSDTLIVGCRNTVIPEGIAAIGENAYFSIEGLSSVVIPDGVKTIGKYAFFCCSDLKDVYVPKSVGTIGEDAFLEDNGNLMIHAEKDSYAWGYAGSNNIKTAEVKAKNPVVSDETPVQKPAEVKYTERKQEISVSKIKKYKAKKLKNRSVSFKLKAKSSGNGKIVFNVKKGKKYITVSKSGKVTLKKGIKKGIYKICITAKAAPGYEETKKIVSVRVK